MNTIITLTQDGQAKVFIFKGWISHDDLMDYFEDQFKATLEAPEGSELWETIVAPVLVGIRSNPRKGWQHALERLCGVYKTCYNLTMKDPIHSLAVSFHCYAADQMHQITYLPSVCVSHAKDPSSASLLCECSLLLR